MTRDRAKPGATTAPAAGSGRASKRRRPRPAVAVPMTMLAFGLMAFGIKARAADAETAEQDYKSGKYEESMQHYQKATESAPTRDDLQFNRGDAAYKAGDFSEAEDAFRKSLETPDLGRQENAYYNLGNAQFQHGAAMQKVDTKKTIKLWEQALHSFDSALKLKTTVDSQHNYDYVKLKLEELKKQQQQKGGQNDQDPSDPDDKGQPDQGSPDQKGNPQNGGQDSQNGGQGQQQADKGGQNSSDKKDGHQMKTYSGTRAQDLKDPNIKTKEDAENLLDSLKDDERHINARSLNGDNQVPPPPSGKDW